MSNSLAELIKTLIDRNISVSVAESLTAGLLQDYFGRYSGVSKIFTGGITTYSLESKVSLLKVNRTEAISCNCVSARVAEQMSNGCRDLFNSDLAISTTGYAEANKSIETPFAFIGISMFQSNFTKKVTGNNKISRNQMREYVSHEALKWVVEIIKPEVI